ncbi:hypothetical protein [Aureitalea marina]|uniref:DUF1801 domain-containing protein n=1 Tax=Aureitalea marina TaxID=930804 RepID=A0A2S7KNY5_9FLAO|nr:hypothetical protein [Aureitalea marina]PQB04339.1 hypothetical protein BST85_05070 [Aureitalea marina]
MTFEDFRNDIEAKLNSIADFELQEYHYEPYSFGNGILAYRIKGQIHKFIFDGRENEMTWFSSKPHQKYFGADFKMLMRNNGLELTSDELKNGIKNSAQQRQ